MEDIAFAKAMNKLTGIASESQEVKPATVTTITGTACGVKTLTDVGKAAMNEIAKLTSLTRWSIPFPPVAGKTEVYLNTENGQLVLSEERKEALMKLRRFWATSRGHAEGRLA